MPLDETGIRPIPASEAVRVLNPTLTCTFGAEGVHLPANVRRRVSEALAHKPLFLQAAELLREGKPVQAEQLLRQCLDQADEDDLKDVRYFGVFWQHGQALRLIEESKEREGSMEQVIQRFAEAIVRYPSEARSAHYVAVAELLTKYRGITGATDAAAILQRGIQALTARGGQLSDRLKELARSSELPRTGEYRPKPLHERVQMTSRGVSRLANTGRGHGEDWVSQLLGEATPE